MRYVLFGLAVIVAVICVCFYLYYIPRFRAWFGARKPQKHYTNEKKNRFAVIVPARNESKVIAVLLESLKNQTYSKELFQVHVVVKEENDPSIALAQQYGATVHIAKEQTCKGDALDLCMKNILKKEPDAYDAYFVLDADCYVKEDCLEEVNNAMADGCQVMLTKKLVKNYLSGKKNLTLSAECNGLIWTLIDDMGNRYKSDHGHTIMTIGTGLLLRSDFVKEMDGWKYRSTLTEDIELMHDCACRGIKTSYCSYAVIYMEEATALHETNKRRRRWLKGVVDSTRLYAKPLKQHVKQEKTKQAKWDRYYANGLNSVIFYIGALTVFSILCTVLGLVSFVFGNPDWRLALLFALSGVGLIYLSFFIMTIFCLIVERKGIQLSFGRKLILLFAHPIFYMGYIPIIAKALLTKPGKNWEVIERIDFEMEECYDKN